MAEDVSSGRPRWVGIDHGMKRVGIAVADPLRIFAQPLGTFSPPEALSRLKKLNEEVGVELAVVGWPLLPDGAEGTATEAVNRFIKRLVSTLPRVEVVRWDERYTSAVAAEKIREAGPNRSWRRNKGRVDSAAAAIILQEYLDERASRTEEASSSEE